MAAMMLLTLGSLALLGGADSVVPTQCSAAGGDEERSCAEVPRAGSAMIQTASASASAGAPLQGRVATLEAEMTSLEGRLSALQDSLGVSGGAAAAVAEVQVDKKEPYAKYALLLRSKSDSAALKDDIASLESRAAELKSKILTLENQVSGNAFAVKFSLLSEGGDKGAHKGTSLESRVEALEEETSQFRTRVTSLEQTVVGLQLKAE
jgi:uncharacterized protein YceH (UPF0502 family)